MNTYEIKWRWHHWGDDKITLVTAEDEMAAKRLVQFGDSGSYKIIIGSKQV
jgi:hypothetical protein